MTVSDKHRALFNETLDKIGLVNREAGIATGLEKSFILSEWASKCQTIPGDYAEIGVWTGGSARIISKSAPKKALLLFDTFEGVPYGDPKYDLTDENGNVIYVGQFALENCFTIAKRTLSDCPNVEFHKGIFPETVKGIERKFAFVHCDADVYPSVYNSCEYFYPRLSIGGVMIFDDYGYKGAPGAKIAVDNFFSGREKITVNKFGQAIMVKTNG